jgi:hypothetical protein
MPQEELKPSWVKLKDMQEHIEELEQLILDMNALLHSRHPHTWNVTREGLLLQQRVRELVRPKKDVGKDS